MVVLVALLVVAHAAVPLGSSAKDYDLPGTPSGQVSGELNFPSAADCEYCHGYDADAADEADAVLFDRWAGGMMAHAADDPLFLAALAVANQDATESGQLCIRCHAPRGWLMGRNAADGATLTKGDKYGVQCVVCHRLVDPHNGEPAISDVYARNAVVLADLAAHPDALGVPDRHAAGMMVVDPEDQRRGPRDLRDDWYIDDCTPDFCGNGNPHRPLDWPLESEFLRESAICGTCHDVDNPLLQRDADGAYVLGPLHQPIAGDEAPFPVERTYSEWRLSEYASDDGVFAPQFDSDGDLVVHTCQDCHMPRMTGVAAFDDGLVPCFVDGDPCPAWLERDDLADHLVVGGNTWLPEARGDSTTAAAALDLLQRAATLDATLDGDGALHVRITNETGHKLPTGYGEGRSMWLHVVVFGEDDAVLLESGVLDADGYLVRDEHLARFTVESAITEEVSALTEILEGPTFHFVLAGAVTLDNRIPPRGYAAAAFAAAGAAPVGATYDDGQHWADVDYPPVEGAVRAEVELVYESASREYIDFLASRSDAGTAVAALHEDFGAPVVIAVARAPDDAVTEPEKRCGCDTSGSIAWLGLAALALSRRAAGGRAPR